MSIESHVPEEFDDLTAEGGPRPFSRPNLLPVTPIGEYVDEGRARRERNRQSIEDFRNTLREAQNPNLTTSERLERLLGLNATILPSLMENLFSDAPNPEHSIVASRAVMAVRDMANMVIRKHETETADDFNPRSPKMQAVFGWFIELFHEILLRNTDDERLVSKVFDEFANELAGWEDRVERRLKGVSSKAIGSLESPFVSGFKERVRGGYTADIDIGP